METENIQGKWFKKVMTEVGRKRYYKWEPNNYNLLQGETCESVFVTDEEIERLKKELKDETN